MGPDVLEDDDLFKFVSQVASLRQQLRHILLPSAFTNAKRLLHWLGAHPGIHSYPIVISSPFLLNICTCHQEACLGMTDMRVE